MASAADARLIGERLGECCRKIRRAESSGVNRVISSSSQWSLADLRGWYARAADRVNQGASRNGEMSWSGLIVSISAKRNQNKSATGLMCVAATSGGQA